MIDRTCLICGKSFKAHLFRIKEGGGNYCSSKCWGTSRVGHKPWNKGLKGIHLSPETEYKKGEIPKGAVLFGQGQSNYVPLEKRLKNENHPQWKGDNANQKTIHSWIKRKFGKAKICEKCGSTKNIGWANKHHTYKRKLDDWMQVCLSCHRKYDIKINNYKGGIIGYNEKRIF